MEHMPTGMPAVAVTITGTTIMVMITRTPMRTVVRAVAGMVIRTITNMTTSMRTVIHAGVITVMRMITVTVTTMRINMTSKV